MRVVEALRGVAHAVAWFVRGVLREDAYERYLAHVTTDHPGAGVEPVLTEREFWRDVADRQDRHPQGRCC